MSDYIALVETRRRFGQLRYGDAYLSDPWWLTEVLRETADAVVYLTLERSRWQRNPLATREGLAALEPLIMRSVHLGQMAANAVRAISGGEHSFQAVYDVRWQYGFEYYGDAYLRRDNLAEALEEFADVEIVCHLERAHAAHRGQPLTPAQHGRLDVIASSARAIAEDICLLHDRIHDHAAIAA
jgi:hypothetical protein